MTERPLRPRPRPRRAALLPSPANYSYILCVVCVDDDDEDEVIDPVLIANGIIKAGGAVEVVKFDASDVQGFARQARPCGACSVLFCSCSQERRDEPFFEPRP